MDNQKYDLEDIKTDLWIIYILRNNLGSIFGGSEEFEDYISANELLLECERMLYKRAGIINEDWTGALSSFLSLKKGIITMKVITSESVFRGHPDKVCDQISDAILDAVLKEDKNSRVAIECAIKDDLILLFGEITTNATVDYSSIAKQVIKDIGYEENFYVLERISLQSNDIALGVDVDGAGDQGIMYGYASNETQELMPLPIVLARRIAIKMDELTRPIRDIFGADGKCQVSVGSSIPFNYEKSRFK